MREPTRGASSASRLAASLTNAPTSPAASLAAVFLSLDAPDSVSP